MNKNVEKKKTYNRLHYVLAGLRKESTPPLPTPDKKQVYLKPKEPSKEEMLMIDRAKYMKIKKTLKYLLKQLD